MKALKTIAEFLTILGGVAVAWALMMIGWAVTGHPL